MDNIDLLVNLDSLDNFLKNMDLPKSTKERIGELIQDEILYLERQVYLELGKKAYEDLKKEKK